MSSFINQVKCYKSFLYVTKKKDQDFTIQNKMKNPGNSISSPQFNSLSFILVHPTFNSLSVILVRPTFNSVSVILVHPTFNSLSVILAHPTFNSLIVI